MQFDFYLLSKLYIKFYNYSNLLTLVSYKPNVLKKFLNIFKKKLKIIMYYIAIYINFISLYLKYYIVLFLLNL